MQNILIVSNHPISPPTYGDSVVAFHWAHLLEKNNIVHALSFGQDDIKLLKIKNIKKTINTFEINKSYTKKIKILIKTFCQEPISIHKVNYKQLLLKAIELNNNYNYKYIILIDPNLVKFGKKLKNNLNKVFYVPMDSVPLYLSRNYKHASFIKKLYLSTQIKSWCRVLKKNSSYYDRIIFVNREDENDISNRLGKLPADEKLLTIPNGVDINKYVRINKRQVEQSQEKYFLLTGTMSAEQTYFAAEEFYNVFVKLYNRYKYLKWYLVGNNPSSNLLKLSKKHPNVIVTGFVPDLVSYLENCFIYVCLMKSGAGIKNRVLEAMAVGNIVVLSEEAASGIDFNTDDPPFIIVKNQNDAYQVIEQIIQNIDQYQYLKKKSRNFIEENYSWDKIGKRINQLLN